MLPVIPVDCKGCGACCSHPKDNKWVEVSAEDAKLIDHNLLQPGDILEFAMLQDEQGRCMALTADGICSIYLNRPAICREVQAGSVICVDSLLRGLT